MLGRNADSDGRAADTSADGDPAALGPYPGLLRLREWSQRKKSDTQHDYERQAWRHGANHFDFGAPALAAPPVVIVLPVTLPPMATPPRLASTLAGGGTGFDGGTK